MPVAVRVSVCLRLVVLGGCWLNVKVPGDIASSAPEAPVPARATACWPPNAPLLLSVIVPANGPADDGVNVTVTVHEAPAATDWLQLFDKTAKFAVTTTLVAPSALRPLFCKVTVCGGLATPTCELPKLTMDGEAEAIGSVSPLPISGTATVPCGSLLAILSEVLRLPPALGENNN